MMKYDCCMYGCVFSHLIRVTVNAYCHGIKILWIFFFFFGGGEMVTGKSYAKTINALTRQVPLFSIKRQILHSTLRR